MGKTGYARALYAIRQAVQPTPSRKENRSRLVKLHEFIARGVLPRKFPINSKKTFRGSLDPERQDEGLCADNPNIRSLANFVRGLENKINSQLFLQLRIMVLEAQIYLLMRKAYEVVVNDKFVPAIKEKYRKWAASAGTYPAIPGEDEIDPLAGSWAEHDRQPDLIVIRPELLKVPRADEPTHAYPELLRQWWRSGRVEASLIDTQGSFKMCQVWQLTSKLGNHRCNERYYQAETWALQAERLKAELLVESFHEQIEMLRNELTEASGVSILETIDPAVKKSE